MVDNHFPHNFNLYQSWNRLKDIQEIAKCMNMSK